jgi:DoxX-like family
MGWASTGLLAFALGGSGILYIVGPPPVVEGFHHLGYPDYFRTLLGIAKVLGIVALVAGGRYPTLREWAYAGFTFDLLAAFLSHLLSGDGPAAASPLIVLALLAGSYVLWHRPRQAARARAQHEGDGGAVRTVATAHPSELAR